MTPSLLTDTSALVLEVQTLPEALERAARDGAYLWTAVRDGQEEEHSLAHLLERSARLARALIAQGFERGERAVIMLPTSEAWLTAFFGTLLAGGVAVPVGPNLSLGGMDRYAETVAAIFRSAGARFLLGSAAIEPYREALQGRGSPVERFLRADLPDSWPDASVSLPTASPDEPAIIQYTSGTTGVPKGVVLSHRALLANAYMIGERVGMNSSDVGVSWLPLFHDMGLVGALLTALYWRYPLLLIPVESFLLQPRRWLRWMSRKRASLTVAPNFAYQLVADRVADRHLEGLDLSRMRSAFNGAEAVRPSTLRAFTERFGPLGFTSSAFQPVYGMAENTLAATFPRKGAHWRATSLDDREIVSVGTPLSGVTVAVVDEQGRPLPTRKTGRIRLKSPSLMQGYFRNEEASAEVLEDGWLDTGDLGFIHEGELFVTGRSKELIIKRGRNYAPDELESVALEAGEGRVIRAAAFSAPDDRAGTERVVLVLETRASTEHESEQLSREVSGALVAVAGIGPDVTLVVPPHTIERTTSGKIRRASLRTRYLDGMLPSQIPLAPAPTEVAE